METNILTTVLITILSVGALSTFVYLVSTVRNLKDKVSTLSLEISDIHTELNHQVREKEVELVNIYKDLDNRMDRVHLKMNRKEEELFRAIQEQVK